MQQCQNADFDEQQNGPSFFTGNDQQHDDNIDPSVSIDQVLDILLVPSWVGKRSEVLGRCHRGVKSAIPLQSLRKLKVGHMMTDKPEHDHDEQVHTEEPSG